MTKDIESLRQEFEELPEIVNYFKMLGEIEHKQYGGYFYKGKPNFYLNGAYFGFRALKEKLEGCVVVPVESCKWTQDEDSNWWTQCGEGFVFNEDSHPHKHNFKNCCFCGGLLEAARGGNE